MGSLYMITRLGRFQTGLSTSARGAPGSPALAPCRTRAPRLRAQAALRRAKPSLQSLAGSHVTCAQNPDCKIFPASVPVATPRAVLHAQTIDNPQGFHKRRFNHPRYFPQTNGAEPPRLPACDHTAVRAARRTRPWARIQPFSVAIHAESHFRSFTTPNGRRAAGRSPPARGKPPVAVAAHKAVKAECIRGCFHTKRSAIHDFFPHLLSGVFGGGKPHFSLHNLAFQTLFSQPLMP